MLERIQTDKGIIQRIDSALFHRKKQRFTYSYCLNIYKSTRLPSNIWVFFVIRGVKADGYQNSTTAGFIYAYGGIGKSSLNPLVDNLEILPWNVDGFDLDRFPYLAFVRAMILQTINPLLILSSNNNLFSMYWKYYWLGSDDNIMLASYGLCLMPPNGIDVELVIISSSRPRTGMNQWVVLYLVLSEERRQMPSQDAVITPHKWVYGGFPPQEFSSPPSFTDGEASLELPMITNWISMATNLRTRSLWSNACLEHVF